MLAKVDAEAWPRSAAWHALRVAANPASAAVAYRAAQQAVDDAKALVKVRQEQLRAARGDLAESVVAAYREGTRVRDLVVDTGLSREWIRQLLRAAGVDPE